MKNLTKLFTIIDILLVISIPILFWYADKPDLGFQLFLLLMCFMRAFLGIALDIKKIINNRDTAIQIKNIKSKKFEYIVQFLLSFTIFAKLIYGLLSDDLYVCVLTSLTFGLILLTILIVLLDAYEELYKQTINNGCHGDGCHGDGSFDTH